MSTVRRRKSWQRSSPRGRSSPRKAAEEPPVEPAPSVTLPVPKMLPTIRSARPAPTTPKPRGKEASMAANTQDGQQEQGGSLEHENPQKTQAVLEPSTHVPSPDKEGDLEPTLQGPQPDQDDNLEPSTQDSRQAQEGGSVPTDQAQEEAFTPVTQDPQHTQEEVLEASPQGALPSQEESFTSMSQDAQSVQMQEKVLQPAAQDSESMTEEGFIHVPVSQTSQVTHGCESDPQIQVANEIMQTLSEVLPQHTLTKANSEITADGIPCETIFQVLEVANADAGATSQSEEQVTVSVAQVLSQEIPLVLEEQSLEQLPLTEEARKEKFWAKIMEVMESRNSDMLGKEKVDRIKNVLAKGGKDVDENARFLFYVRSRQFALKTAPEFGWLDEVVCEPTREEDVSDQSLLGNWRRVAYAEEIYDLLKDIHERCQPHKNYRKTYLEVSKMYSRIPRHICREFVSTCPGCTMKKCPNPFSPNKDGTPRRPLKRPIISPGTPIRFPKMMKMNIEDFKVKGLIAAPFTPFTDNGDLNLKLIPKYVDTLLQDGVDSVFVLGTTAEGLSLSMKERKLVAAEWVKYGKKKLDSVIVQVGTTNLKETQELAMHAASIGASAIGVLPPFYYKPQTPEHLINYLKQVGAIVPTMPLLYYHIPKNTGVNFTMMDILRALEVDPIPNFKGAKFATKDLTDFSLSVNVSKDKYQMIYSIDGLILPSMTLGGEAYIGSTFNFAGRVFSRLLEAYSNGDIERARAEQFRMHAFLDVINRYEKIAGSATLKYTMSLARFDVGPPRPPLSQMSPEDVEALRKELCEIGFFDWIN